jgi:hypothetical protein
LLTANYYVGYRSLHPDEKTRKKVSNKLKGIKGLEKVSQLVEYRVKHCQ